MSGLGSEAAVIIRLVFSGQYQLCPAGTLMTWRREEKKYQFLNGAFWRQGYPDGKEHYFY